MMYRVYCYSVRESKPIFVASFDTLEEAEGRANGIAQQARLAREQPTVDKKYFAEMYKLVIKNDNGDVQAEITVDAEE